MFSRLGDLYMEWLVHSSALEHCTKIKFTIQLDLTVKNKIQEYCHDKMVVWRVEQVLIFNWGMYIFQVKNIIGN